MSKKDRLLDEWLRAVADLDKARERHKPTHRIIEDIRRVKSELTVLIRAEQPAKVGI